MRRCTKCGQAKPLTAYHRSAASPKGRKPECKRCTSARLAVYNAQPDIKKRQIAYRARPEIRVRLALCNKANKYGISFDFIEYLWRRSGGRCENSACRALLQSITAAHIDHDHVTGKVRGLLCQPCNHMLGRAKDRIAVLQGGITYLRKHGGKE